MSEFWVPDDGDAQAAEWLGQAPRDGGVSSLSGSATRRREGAHQFTARMHALIETWRCIWCKGPLPRHPRRYFYCRDSCSQESLAEERAKRNRGEVQPPVPESDEDEPIDIYEEGALF